MFPLLIVAILAAFRYVRRKPVGESNSALPASREPVTFCKEIAPIIFHNCSGCHRPGMAAPFSLLTFDDVKKRDRQIVTVTHQRLMPPWLPEKGYGDFQDERRLSDSEIELLARWVSEGALEGNRRDLPPAPQWPDSWQLGKPDLVVTMPAEYVLAADGKDVYRNFVMPIPLAMDRYIRAVEFRPGSKAVHHAFLRIDATRQSRRLDEKDPEVGFPGMSTPASPPQGHNLSWQPGKIGIVESEEFSWLLKAGSDLVVQMHMQPSGKPEPIQATAGFFFSSRPPSKTPALINLTSQVIDIPAGMTNYVVERRYTLPVDADLLSILPHAHYVAKEMQGFAQLPDGTRKWLILIKNWDFNWQTDYRYQNPIDLPKGTILVMRFTYDNSTNNVRNPNQPPRPVAYGLQTTDEMAELWFQLVPRKAADLAVLGRDFQSFLLRDLIEYNEWLLQKDPHNSVAHNDLGKGLSFQGRVDEALLQFTAAIRENPRFPDPHYNLAVLHGQAGRFKEAETEYLETLRLVPENLKARNNLAVLLMKRGDLNAAESHLRQALQTNPDDAMAKENLELISKARPQR